MATKLQHLSELSAETYKSLSDFDNWTKFMKSAAWQYKYPFADRLMIYAQRPDATACASLEVWNNKLHRWINKGSRGIALPRYNNGKTYIDYVFDISDTNSFYGNEVTLWQYQNRYKDAIIETLENTFGDLSDKSDIFSAVTSAAHNAIEDNKADYLAEFKYNKEGSFLEELDELNIDVEFQNTAENSVAFIIMERLGFNSLEYFERDDFPHIMDFNTPSTLNLLGNAISSISEQALREISNTISAEKKKSRKAQEFFAENKNAEYNEDTDKQINQTVEERMDTNDRENSIQTGGRLSDTRPPTPTGEQTDRQIRTNEREILEGTPQQPIHDTSLDGQADRASVGDERGSEQTDRTDGTENGEGTGHQRGTENEQSFGMDRTYEQPQTRRRRNRNEPPSAQLSLFENFFPTEETQKNIIREAEQFTFGSAFSIAQDYVDDILRSGSNSENSVLETCIEFSKNKDLASKADYLKDHYEIGGKGFIFDDTKISVWWNADGMNITYGTNAQTADTFLSWEEVAKRIDELLDIGRFAPQETLDKMQSYEFENAARTIWYMEREIDKEEYPEKATYFKDEWFEGGYPDGTARIQKLLNTSKGLNEISEAVNNLNDAFAENRDIIRFKIYAPTRVKPIIDDLFLPRKVYTADITMSLPQRFISDDEVNHILRKGTGTQDGKYRVYRYFSEHTDPTERKEFVKKEYGSYGSLGHTYSMESANKGLTISRKDILSPFAKLEFKWTDIVKKIDTLIKTDSYLTEQEKNEGYPAYLEEQHRIEEERRIHKERVAYVESADNFSDDEKRSTLPKRLFYYIQTIDNYDKRKLEQNGLPEFMNANELLIADYIKDPDVKTHLVEVLEKIYMGTSGIYTRNYGRKLQDELAEVKSILIDENRDFYTISGEYAREIHTLLELPESRIITDENGIDSISFPNDTSAEIIFDALTENSYLYVCDNMEEIEALQNFFAAANADDIQVERIGNSIVAYDDENTWTNDEVYDFVLNEMLIFNKDGTLAEGLSFSDEILEPIKYYASEKYGVDIKPVKSDDELTFAEFNDKLKAEYGEKSVILYPIGDFYEVYGNDVETVSNILNIEKTHKVVEGIDYPMTGFPKHIYYNYRDKLRENGITVIVTNDGRGTEVYRPKIDTTQMTSDEKEGFVDAVELARDYSLDITEEEANAYDDIIQEQSAPPITTEQTEDFSQYIGREIEVDDRKFVVDSINDLFSKVSLKDITFQDNVGYPIFRSESLEWLKLVIQEQEQKEDKPLVAADKPKPTVVRNTVVYPEIPMSERNNFTITDDELGYGGAKEKFRNNMAAIKVLKECEFENRLATPEEQEILSKYVGWGGLPEAFDESKDNWASEFAELYATLTPEEYEQARASTLNAHYTSPTVIKAMYKAIENMGFKQGNILEPSCGIGNFMGLVPDSMSDSKIYGIELDSLTGRIAQQLYQKNSIAIQGFEDTTLPDSCFDVAIGNVPFGNYKIADKKYNKHNFFIHDYFFAKTLDKVRPGGIVAFITSMGTLDKKNPAVRKYIAQRADLLGAIRLPNNAFLKNANTQVTADILFLQKRDRMTDIMPEWVNLGTDENGLSINQYFIDNPDMILGEMTEESSQYGQSITCRPYENTDLAEQLDDAIQNIHAQITEYEFEDISNDEDFSIPADPNVRNFSYTLVDGEIYFRENSMMHKVELNATAENRIKGLIEIRDCVRTLIEYQTEDYPDYEIKKQQDKLNTLYDNFTKKYGLINSRGNALAFSEDSGYFLLCSLEKINENGELEQKADIFTKRTIGAKKQVTQVDTSSEALAVSLAEKAKVDMEFMISLTGKTEDEIVTDLENVIFLNPEYSEESTLEAKYLTADEYLSGNVRKKLQFAELKAEIDSKYIINVEALKAVQPQDLTAADISVKLGTTWIPPKYFEQFTHELLDTPYRVRSDINVMYYKPTAEWNVAGKSRDKTNVKANNTYGTHRANAYKIIEDTLNQRDVRIFDYKYNENGSRVAVLNVKETAIAQQKQEAIKQAFLDWIWKDPDRRETLTKRYNEIFNSTRPREYDGSHITFNGMNPEIKLRQHQKDAVARIMYGGNSLLGHVVGAGKTWTMVAAAMESKRLGLCNKSLFVVPNHLTEQWASEFLELYPAANILVATKKDFETKNRKKFCGRIATGDYDAVIIGHSQFEKIPMSAERQRAIIERQIREILESIREAKESHAENYTVKQMEKTRRNLEDKLKKLNDQSRKDDIVTFEELGVDRIFVDEAHYYKNLFLYTKMRNVGGIAQTEAQKSSDLFMKTQYLDELTGGRGVIFATGTPISNSMVEMYTMQRYLQYGTLAERELQQFDAWASTYGETVTSIELAPEGTGYRAKTRFAKFFNLPELMNMFKEVADIQTADMLKLPVPEAEYHNIAAEPTEIQKAFVAECGRRADTVRKGDVDPTVDNMLKITNDGRKIALDQRMDNPMLPDDERSKVNLCVNNVYDIWEKHADTKATQLIFCDMSTPKNDDTFSVYTDIRDKLIEKGVPESEIDFIHNADTEVRKKELFSKVRKGDVRILLGSTAKMGAGTNVQKRLIASHDLDCPWRPADLEQRAGRIIRQGNTNDKVHIYRYVTKDTFDSYMWQTVENKQKFISQIMTSKSPVRSAEDIDETALSYAEIKALSTGNPHIKEKMELDTQVSKLKLVKSSFQNAKFALEDKVIKYYPQQIATLTQRIKGLEQDTEVAKQHPKQEDKFNPMTIDGIGYFEKKTAGEALIERCKKLTDIEPVIIGDYRGFQMSVYIEPIGKTIKLELKNNLSYPIELGADVFGNIQRLDNAIDGIEPKIAETTASLEDTKKQFEVAKVECKKEFPQEAELQEKLQRLAALDALLNMDKKGNDGVVMAEPDEMEQPQRKKHIEMER